jgi:hypothetical protein
MTRRLAALTAGIIALMLLAGLFNAYTQPKTGIIRFDVGHDIQETARASGLAEFQTQSSMQTYAAQRAQMNAEKRGAADTALDKAERERVQKLPEDEAVKRGEPLAR